jgi:G8 domain
MANQVVNQGTATSINLGQLSDPGSSDGPWTIAVNWGDNTAPSSATTSSQGNLTLTHAYAGTGSYYFAVTVTNAAGGSTTLNSFVTVVTPGPVVTASPGHQTVSKGVSANVNLGSFLDPGVNAGPWNVSVNWGDASAPSTFQVTVLAGWTQAHVFAANGSYTLAVTVTNALGQSVSATGAIIVVTPAAATDDTAPLIVTPYDTIPNFGAHPTVFSVQSGAWSSPSTWSTGVVPASTAVVSIEPNTTVSYDVVSSAAVNTVIIQNGGQLVFRTDINTTLTVLNLLVLEGGTLQVGTQANPVAAGVKAQIVFPDIAINTAADPSQYGNGLIALGTVTMYGAALNQTWVALAVEPHAGDTTLTLSQPVTGWLAGDKIILPDTSQPDFTSISEWEYLTIASISANGTVLTLSSPLQYNHLGAYDGNGVLDFLPDVGDLTRNVVVKSANPSGTRGYTLFTDRANVNIQYVQFSGLGRTTSALGDSTTYDASGNVTHLGTNPMGRYAVYFDHLFGPSTTPADGYQFTFVNNSVACPLNGMNFRWGIALEDSSYGLVQGNVLYNWYGAGIITVDGSESYNVIAQNFVVRIGGSGLRPDQSPQLASGLPDLGTEGASFWFAGPNNIISGNVAADVFTGGWAYGYLFYDAGNVAVSNFKGADTSVSGQTSVVNMNNTPLLGFTGNQVYASSGGLSVWFLGASFSAINRTVGQSVIKDLVMWHVWLGVFEYPMNNVVFEHWVVRGYEPDLLIPQVGSCAFGTVDYLTANVIFDHCDIQGMEFGIEEPYTIGFSADVGQTSMPFVIQNSYLRNYYNIYVDSQNGVNSAPNTLVPRSTIIRNVQFAQVSIMDKNNDPQYNIVLAQTNPGTYNNNWILLDQVFVYDYNQTPSADFQLYFAQQQASAILPGTSTFGLGAPVAGLTNTQAWTAFGIAFAGAIAPTNATTLSFTNALIVPI